MEATGRCVSDVLVAPGTCAECECGWGRAWAGRVGVGEGGSYRRSHGLARLLSRLERSHVLPDGRPHVPWDCRQSQQDPVELASVSTFPVFAFNSSAKALCPLKGLGTSARDPFKLT